MWTSMGRHRFLGGNRWGWIGEGGRFLGDFGWDIRSGGGLGRGGEEQGGLYRMDIIELGGWGLCVRSSRKVGLCFKKQQLWASFVNL